MSEIVGLDGLSVRDLKNEIDKGGKFVIYLYCISILIMTFKQPSKIYFIKNGESAFAYGLQYSLITWLLGWWGIPFGPIYSLQALINNISGKDVTNELLQGPFKTAFEALIFQELLQSVEGKDTLLPEISSTSATINPVKQPEYKKCPFCAEDIKNDAIVCRYCHRDLPKTEISLEDQDSKQPIIRKEQIRLSNVTDNTIQIQNIDLHKKPFLNKVLIVLITIMFTIITIVGLFLSFPYISKTLFPQPILTIYIQPTIKAAINPTSQPTKYLAPSKTSILHNCRSWTKITLLDVGDRLCVYGKIFNITWDNIAYYIAFSNKQNAFYILSYDFYYPDVEIGMCIMTTGEIKRLDNNPVIVILKNTELFVISNC